MDRRSGLFPIVGWREWVGLPDLGVTGISAKVDTGARSSALHAFDVERFERDGRRMVRFAVHPLQHDDVHRVAVEAVLLDERPVRTSAGTEETRPVIATTVALGGCSWPIELTLTRRDQMGFRMLLGRQALRGRFIVDPARSFVFGTHAPPQPPLTLFEESAK